MAIRVLILIFGMFSQKVWSEYRAYQLRIVNNETGQEKLVLSTFDNIQYRGFYTLGPGDEIEIVNTWMCWENTSYHKPICPPPQEAEALPTGNTRQKTNSQSQSVSQTSY